MPRGKLPLREDLAMTRRIGRPPRTERSTIKNGRSANESFYFPYAVIRSNFRRGGISRSQTSALTRRSSMNCAHSGASPTFMDLSMVGSLLKCADFLNGRSTDHPESDRPSTSGVNGERAAVNGLSVETSSAPSHSNNQPSASSTDASVVPCRYEDINLVSIVDGALSGVSGTVKDLASLDNLKKLPVDCQQHLLRMLPRGDCMRRDDGAFEPTFSALKNEYLSAALLDFNERLYAGEISPTGQILETPPDAESRVVSPSTSSARAATPVVDEMSNPPHSSNSPGMSSSAKPGDASEGALNSLPSTVNEAPAKKRRKRMTRFGPRRSSLRRKSQKITAKESLSKVVDRPPLPLLRINVVSKQLTYVPRSTQYENHLHLGDVAINRFTFNGSDAGSNGSSDSGTSNGIQAETIVKAIDFLPVYISKPVNRMTNSALRENDISC